MLTDGVLLIQHTQNDRGVSLINPGLQNILGLNPADVKLFDNLQSTSSFKATIVNMDNEKKDLQGDTGGGPAVVENQSISENQQTFRLYNRGGEDN